MKKTRILLFTLVSVLGLASCGGSDTPSDSTGTSTVETPSSTVTPTTEIKEYNFSLYKNAIDNSFKDVKRVVSNSTINDGDITVYQAKKSITKITKDSDSTISCELTFDEYNLNSSFKLEKSTKVINYTKIEISKLFGYKFEESLFTTKSINGLVFEGTLNATQAKEFFGVDTLDTANASVKFELKNGVLYTSTISYVENGKNVDITTTYYYA